MEIQTDRPVLANKQNVHHTIAAFWDNISSQWSEIWGPHIHHGFYPQNRSLTPLEAQENLLHQLVEKLNISPHSTILDVGCGMGGSSFYLQKHFLANVIGITLSPKQVEIAKAEAKRQSISEVSFRIDNALEMKTIPDASVDLVWSLESCEQFFDKSEFIRQVNRVLKPGGTLLLATWCSSEDHYQGKTAKQYIKTCRAFDLPYMPTIEYYADLIKASGLTLQLKEDWSPHVAKSWEIGMSLLNAHVMFKLLLKTGLRGFQFARRLHLMRDGFKTQTIRYGVFKARKPSLNESE